MPIYMNQSKFAGMKAGDPTNDLARLGVSGPEVVGYSMSSAVAVTELRSARYVGRPLTADDFPEYSRVMDANRERLKPSGQAGDLEERPTFEEFVEWVDQLTLLRSLDQRYEFGWFDGETLMAGSSLWGVIRGQAQSAFVAGWVAASHAHADAGGEGFFATCRFGFEELGLHRLEAPVLLDNEAVGHLFERLGLRDEGVAEGLLSVNGEWRDHRRYVITADEWQARADD